MTADSRTESLKFLPDPGEDRWWRVGLNPKSRTNPVVISLMECFSPGRKAMSKPLLGEYCTANEKDLREAAEKILARIADYKIFVGDYGVGGFRDQAVVPPS